MFKKPSCLYSTKSSICTYASDEVYWGVLLCSCSKTVIGRRHECLYRAHTWALIWTLSHCTLGAESMLFNFSVIISVSNKSCCKCVKGVGGGLFSPLPLTWICGLGSGRLFSLFWSVSHLSCLSWTCRTPLITSLFCVIIFFFWLSNNLWDSQSD